jgi:hypothetical protein
MKFFGAIVAFTAVSADFCFKTPTGYTVNLRKEGTRLQVNARAPQPWMGFGIPKTKDATMMGLGNFVVGAGGQVFDRIRTTDTNGHPDKEGKNGIVAGTQNVSTVNGITVLSFERELSPPGYHPIDTSKPFNMLWAHGMLGGPGKGYDSAQYHHTNRGHIKVDMNTPGNCDAATLALFKKETPKPAAPTPKGGVPPADLNSADAKGAKGEMKAKGGKVMTTGMKGVKGKKAKAKSNMKSMGKTETSGECEEGKVKCTAAHQSSGANCVVGMCFTLTTKTTKTTTTKTVTSECEAGKVPCTLAHQKAGANCILGACHTPTSG